MLTADLPRALAAALADLPRGDPEAALVLSARYRDASRRGGAVATSAADALAYATTRLPATYAAVRIALGELRERVPSFAPLSLLDLGAGSGAAIWAAAELWPSLAAVVAVEAEPEMARLGRRLAGSSPSAAVSGATFVEGRLSDAFPPGRFDLVTVSYVLDELDEEERRSVLARAWAAAAGAVVVVEPGTTDGYRRVLAARTQLLAAGATTVAPCPHDAPCPLPEPDWCHFAVRLPRSSAHRAAKGAARGHEDEKFSYVVLARGEARQADGRILRHPQVRPGHVLLRLSTRDGIRDETVSKRHRERYRAARKASWGDDLRA